ncbi:MAG: c-type cytochrome [Burkholderiaceae bacterium]
MGKFVSRWVALMTCAGWFAATAWAQAPTGNVQAGQSKAAMCIGCHGIAGYQNSFPEIHKVPKIAGQTAGYLQAALLAYQKGERKHPTMRGIAGSLNEQDMADLAAFYAQLAPEVSVPEQAPKASAKVQALFARGGCVACHGANYNKPLTPAYPKVAGQHADYLYVALKSYQVQGNAVVGRNNAIMAGIVKQFNLNELKAMADHLAGLPGSLDTVPQSRWR